MKWLIFSLLLLVSQSMNRAQAQTPDTVYVVRHDTVWMQRPTMDSIYTSEANTRYDRRIHRYRKRWYSLVPTYSKLQFAGNMGLLSVGFGWDYGKHNQWETHLLFGYLPKADSDRGKLTMTLKQTFLPWSFSFGKGWMLEPLSCGIYFNTVFGSEFWGNQPSRYPDKYYEPLNTEVRINAFLGQRITLNIPENKRKFVKSVSAFYEVSTCDLYLRLAVMERKVSVWDILGLSVGVKFQIM